MFYIIPTPIGNIEDITIRALNILKMCDYILCENTQKIQSLLIHFNIQNKSCFKYTTYSNNSIEQKVINDLNQNKNIVLVSEAGMPGISDPGNKIINKIISLNLPITCLPGPTSIIPAIILSGFNEKEFTFIGFLPHKGRTKIYEEIKFSKRNIVCFESIHRIKKTLNDLYNILDKDRKIAICREISKKYEEIIRFKVQDIKNILQILKLKGEIVLVIEGNK